MSNVAFLTGITGQDGSYLAELLLEKGYEVHGVIRRSSSFNTSRIDHIFDRLHLHFGDLSDGSTLARLLGSIRPSEVYNLGAQSHVRVSFDCPEYTFDIDATGTLRLLEAIRSSAPDARFYQASSSEMFGSAPAPQDERTPFEPCSPYACAKVASYFLTKNYRLAYDMHASNGILFNHESPRRGFEFVSRKITSAVARIKLGLSSELRLGNLEAKRDWGHSADYVRAMHSMLQLPNPDDFVIASGEAHSVRELCEIAFAEADLDYREFVKVDQRYYRPSEVDQLVGDASKARRVLGWEPTYTFRALVKEMVSADLAHTAYASSNTR